MADKKTGDLMQIPCFTYESPEGGVERGGSSHIRTRQKSASISPEWAAPQKPHRLEASSNTKSVARTVRFDLIWISCIARISNVLIVGEVHEVCI